MHEFVPAIRRNVPSWTDINKHWLKQGSFPGVESLGRMSFDSVEMCCFACGWWHLSCPNGCHHGIERAHVIPHASGGSDSDPDNYALLCKPCHAEAPDTTDVDYFWRWVAEYPEDRNPLEAQRRRAEDVVNMLRGNATAEELDTLIGLPTDEMRNLLSKAAEVLKPVTHNGQLSKATLTRLTLGAVRLARGEAA